jgi:hypothetical protein
MESRVPSDGAAALERVVKQFKSKKAAKALLDLLTPPPDPSLAVTLARYREDGLLQPSRKGAR